MGTKLLSPLIAATQDILYSLPRLNADQRLVLACVLRAAVVDLADVVGVAQEPVKLADRDWLGGTLEAWDAGQAACDQFIAQRLECPHVGCELLERPCHDRTTFGVDLDALLFTAVDDLADVEVADDGPADAAATAGFLLHALDDFGGQVGGVELGHAAEDRVHQDALRCLVDVFSDRHQRRAGVLDRQGDLDVVSTVACQAVHLMHDDVLHRVFGEVGEHCLKLRPCR